MSILFFLFDVFYDNFFLCFSAQKECFFMTWNHKKQQMRSKRCLFPSESIQNVPCNRTDQDGWHQAPFSPCTHRQTSMAQVFELNLDGSQASVTLRILMNMKLVHSKEQLLHFESKKLIGSHPRSCLRSACTHSRQGVGCLCIERKNFEQNLGESTRSRR